MIYDYAVVHMICDAYGQKPKAKLMLKRSRDASSSPTAEMLTSGSATGGTPRCRRCYYLIALSLSLSLSLSRSLVCVCVCVDPAQSFLVITMTDLFMYHFRARVTILFGW